MIMTRKWMALLAGVLLLSGLAACQKKDEGPAERVGKKLDEAASTAAEKIEEVTSKVGEKMQEAGKSIQKAADDAKN
ncbi:hypothetical protein GCM10007205_28180 [Oxalicibacterium flavum]|uniref:YtxH domain-containing protein n=1 Tax=Oxalicibacterium flavum TaxID=179467 RepID=A0A8J2UNX2_9BURK|nr:hypothetical protein GCM10007205_28180 [Oxalicibacterium flavum]